MSVKGNGKPGKKVILVSVLAVGLILAGVYIIYNSVFLTGILLRGEENEEEQPSLPAASLLEDTPPELEDALRLEILQAKPFPEAEDELLELSRQTSAVGYLATLELARHYREEGESALPYYRLALFLHDDDDVRLEMAGYLEEEGFLDRAWEEYLSLLPEDKARQGLLRLEPDIPALAAQILAEEHWEVALKFLEPLVEKEDNEDLKRMYARALVGLGEFEEALPLLEQYWTANPADEEMGFWYARVLEIMGEEDSALLIYTGLGEKGNHRRGVILEQKNRLTEAATALSQAAQAEARWRGAFLWERLGHPENALPIYKDLGREPGTYQDDAAYRAYLLLSREGEPAADEFLEYLAAHPAWMERLDKPLEWETKPELEAAEPRFIKLTELYREWEMEDLAALEFAIGRDHADLPEKAALGEWYLEQDDYFSAVRLGIQLLREHPCPRSYRLAYPLPYQDEVNAAAEEYQLDPYLILAVMREESHFRAEVASGAGARGLMQIMPATGKDIAERKGMDFQLAYLSDPEINIRFGAFYLRAMLNMFAEDLDKALAAYNGGPGNARRWEDSFLGRQEGGFPTAITFLETREYITKVKNSYLTYKWLYNN